MNKMIELKFEDIRGETLIYGKLTNEQIRELQEIGYMFTIKNNIKEK